MRSKIKLTVNNAQLTIEEPFFSIAFLVTVNFFHFLR